MPWRSPNSNEKKAKARAKKYMHHSLSSASARNTRRNWIESERKREAMYF